MSKPLFVPLMTQYYDAFASGQKHEELRLYGKRWNEKTCPVGREVILSKGYGKQNRMKARIWEFRKRDPKTFGSTYQQAVIDRYGSLDVVIAEIRLTDFQPLERQVYDKL